MTREPHVAIRQMATQYLFDTICHHLIRQGRPALHEESCAYLAPDGARCAVGVLLTPEEAAEMEGRTMRTALKNGVFPKRLMPYVAFLEEMQCVHDLDSRQPVEEWRASWMLAARDVARRHGLSTAVLDEAT